MTENRSDQENSILMTQEWGDPVSDEEGSSEEPWLVSYADLMTLLFGFFAMLFTFSTFEGERATVEISSGVAKHMEVSLKSMEKVATDLTQQVQKMNVGKDIQLTLVEEGKGLEIAFDNSILFTLGNADLLPDATKSLFELMEVLKSSGKDFIIRIEGHTDDNPIKNNTHFPSNWELSGARAATIVRLFESRGFAPDTLTAVGYGSARPFLPNRDSQGKVLPENQAKNRRVLVKVALNLEKMLKQKKEKENQIEVNLKENSLLETH